jgi:hypothetical protein
MLSFQTSDTFTISDISQSYDVTSAAVAGDLRGPMDAHEIVNHRPTAFRPSSVPKNRLELTNFEIAQR